MFCAFAHAQYKGNNYNLLCNSPTMMMDFVLWGRHEVLSII